MEPAKQSKDIPPSYEEAVGGEEAPPAYSSAGGRPNAPQRIECRVCRAAIDIPHDYATNVIKCNICSEVTPVKAAPPGKRFVRCPCHALLITELTTLKLKCPRQTCNRTLVVKAAVHGLTAGNRGPGSPSAASVTVTVSPLPPGSIRAHCAHCGQLIRFTRIQAASSLCRCPFCGQTSTVGDELKKRKLALFFSIGILFLMAGIGVTIGTLLAAASGGFYVIWIGAFVVGVVNLIRGFMWTRTKVSQPLDENQA